MPSQEARNTMSHYQMIKKTALPIKANLHDMSMGTAH
jgi:hypothetical protein